MSLDQQPSPSEKQPSLVGEFNVALQETKNRHRWKNIKEFRLGERLQAVVLFGSLTTKEPKLVDGVLKTDADLLLLYDGTGEELYRSEPKGTTLQDFGPFSERIPNADIMVMNISMMKTLAETSKKAMRRELETLKKALAPGSHTRSQYWMYDNNAELAASFRSRLPESTIMAQIVLTGAVLQGSLPEPIVELATDVMRTYSDVAKEISRLVREHGGE